MEASSVPEESSRVSPGLTDFSVDINELSRSQKVRAGRQARVCTRSLLEHPRSLPISLPAPPVPYRCSLALPRQIEPAAEDAPEAAAAPLLKAASDAHSTNLRQLAQLTLEGNEEESHVSQPRAEAEDAALAAATQGVKGEPGLNVGHGLPHCPTIPKASCPPSLARQTCAPKPPPPCRSRR